MVVVQPIRKKEKIQEIQNFLREDPRDYLLFVLGLNTALRVGDMLRLKASDVRSKGQVKDMLKVRISETGKQKRIALSLATKKALRFFFKCNPGLVDSGFLFTGIGRDKPMSRVNAWMILKRIAEKFDLPDIGTHSLRKTWGYQARKAGIDLSIIQKKLGHRTPGITKRYIGITDDEVHQVERKFCL